MLPRAIAEGLRLLVRVDTSNANPLLSVSRVRIVPLGTVSSYLRVTDVPDRSGLHYTAHRNRQPQHPAFNWIGGHLTVPKEQNTQQSPLLGRNNVRHCLHS